MDQLILEEETATSANIDAIHMAGKKVSVWTVNNPVSILRFFTRGADAIITDQVDSGVNMKSFFVYAEEPGNESVLDLVKVVLYTFFVLWP